MSGQEPRLVMFSIGPVQDFIAGARTVRDLWTGSFILSHLAQQAGAAFEREGGSLLYPTAFDRRSGSDSFVATFPNKFTVRLDATKITPATAAAETAVRDEWRRLATAVRQFLKDRTKSDWDQGWDQQVDNLLECYWASVPEGGNGLAQANLWLDGRKRLRDFAVYTGDGREKDSIDGLFEQMGPREVSRETSRQFWDGLRTTLEQRGALSHLGESERLSAINLTKRFAAEVYFKPQLPDLTEVVNSTSDVATMWWRSEVQKLPEAKEAITAYQSTLQEVLRQLPEAEGEATLDRMEGRFLYREVLAELAEQHPKARPALNRLQDSLKRLGSVAVNNGPPPRYYALLFLDGDKMGRYLSRQPLDRLGEVSTQLLEYARLIRQQIAPRYQATVVYTGGDDALLMLPTATALDCAIALQKAFPLPETTVSMGLTLAHYKYPLQRALAEGRRTEKKAKDDYGRNALAISVIKRSGEQVQTGSKWQEIGEGEIEVFPLLSQLHRYFRQEWLSPKLPYRLRQETALIAPDNRDAPDNRSVTMPMQDQLVSEFRRLFRRQSNPPKGDEQASRDLAELGRMLERIARVMKFNQFNDLLLVAAFLARGSEDE